MRFLKAFFRFWYDFIIGDDWKIAAAIVTALLLGALAVVLGAGGSALLPPLLAVAIGAAFAIALLVDLRPRHRR
jgi:uncharacterized membrane protein YccC